MNFDPEGARVLYSQKETEELVRIAELESGYLAEARYLAEQELARRAITDSERKRIVEVLKREKEEFEDEQWEKRASWAHEVRVPFLKLALRQKRKILGVLIVLMLFSSASFQLEWNVFFGYDRWIAFTTVIVLLITGTRAGLSGKHLRQLYGGEEAKESEETASPKKSD